MSCYAEVPIGGHSRRPMPIWEFPKIRGLNIDTKEWGSDYKDMYKERNSYIVPMVISTLLPYIHLKPL